MKIPSKILTSIINAGLAPEGDYELEIERVDAGYAKNNKKSYRIVIDFQINRGEYEGSAIKSVFTVENPENPEAAKIGSKQFRKMLDKLGLELNDKFDTDNLKGRTLQAHVGIEAAREGYAAYNKVKYFI